MHSDNNIKIGSVFKAFTNNKPLSAPNVISFVLIIKNHSGQSAEIDATSNLTK